MINKIMKNIIALALAVLAISSANAQGSFGLDEQKCKENLSLYREYYKQKNYSDAYGPWLWTFNNCPESSGNIYKNGPKILKGYLKDHEGFVNDETQDYDVNDHESIKELLMSVFDQRIQYFGKEGYVLGLKGFELIGLDKSRSEEALGYLQRSIDLEENNSSVQAVYGYMKAMVNLEKSGDKTKADVLEAYALVSEVIDYNIVNESKATKNFIKYSEKVEDLFTPYANCEDLVTLFSAKFDPTTEDISYLNRVVEMLEKGSCTSEKLFFEASSRLHELDPSASSADKMAKMSIAKGKLNDAIKFAKKAIELEDDLNKKAKYFLVLANAYRNKGSYSSARNSVYSALEIKRGWGEAYMNLGWIYVAGAKICGNNFEQKAVYWIAVDNFKKARNDEETKDIANKEIKKYKIYFPSIKLCFEHSKPYNTKYGLSDKNVIANGDQYNIGCWINKSTIVRTLLKSND